jgi:ferric-dicitrate binding protein FerR (iron transport regulator)
MTEPTQNYLWDKSGTTDQEIERLESLLAQFRSDPPPMWIHEPLPGRAERRPVKRLWLSAVFALAAPVLVSVALSIHARFEWRPGDPWKVVALNGTPQIGSSLVKNRGQFSVGQILVTDAASRARIRVADLGVVDVEPGSRVRLIATHAKRHQIALDYGTISVRMWAPPFSLAVDTPSASLFDLGCAFTLHVESGGYGTVQVTSGWVEFETPLRSVIIPAGAEAVTRPELGPGTPHFSDDTPTFKTAVSAFDSHPEDDGARAAAVASILANAHSHDALTLLSLLNQLPLPRRAMVLDRLAAFVPIPDGYSREDALNLHTDAMDAYWTALHLGTPKSWFMNWKDVLSY